MMRLYTPKALNAWSSIGVQRMFMVYRLPVRWPMLIVGCALCTLPIEPWQCLAQQVEAEEALNELSRLLHVEERNELAVALRTRAEAQELIEKYLRAIVATRAEDTELNQLRREAVEQLSSHATDRNVKALLHSIDLIAPPLAVSHEFAFGQVELFYPSTHVLIANIGVPVIPLSIEEVTDGGLGWELNEELDTKLELLAYTLLSIQRDVDEGPQAPISDEMRQKLIEQVRSARPLGARAKQEIINRFIELLEAVEPSIYRFPRMYDEQKHRLPRGSRIFELDNETGKLRFLPLAAYVNRRLIEQESKD